MGHMSREVKCNHALGKVVTLMITILQVSNQPEESSDVDIMQYMQWNVVNHQW